MLQETKTASGVCASQAFLRLGTDSERHWGVAVWISREIGLFTAQGKPVLVTENDIRVVYIMNRRDYLYSISRLRAFESL